MLPVIFNVLVFLGVVLHLPTFGTTIDYNPIYQAGSQVKIIKSIVVKPGPVSKNPDSLGMEVSAQSAMVVDQVTGQVLWQKNPQGVRSIASITKLMTALVFLDHNPGWSTEVKVMEEDYSSGGRRWIYLGWQLNLEDLFKLSLTASSNEATSALVRATGLSGQDFVGQMNAKARELGMLRSSFVEPVGLNPANVSTAEDIVRLLQRVSQMPEILNATSQIKVSVPAKVSGGVRMVSVPTTNTLLGSYLKILGGKTGFLEEAGYCLATIVSDDSGHNIIIVALASPTTFERFADVKALAWWAFNNFIWP